MKMKGRKATVFFIMIPTYIALLILTIFFAKEALNIFGVALVSAMTLISIAYIGGTIWKDYIKSVHFRKELWENEKENNTDF